MGQSLTSEADMVLRECTRAGVVFRPRRGQLRPELTAGRPPDGLLDRVKANREGILRSLALMMEFDDIDAESEETC